MDEPVVVPDLSFLAHALVDVEPVVTARVKGHPVRIRQSLRHRAGEAPTVRLGFMVCLSVEDVTTRLLACNPTYEELTDDATLRELVAETVLNRGCLIIEDWRHDLRNTPRYALDEGKDAYAEFCRSRAVAVFGYNGWRLLLCWWFPYAPCRSCHGAGRHRSGNYWRPCRRCRGTGRKVRLGRRIWQWTRSEEHT